ncbi:UNVERIFIED_CONTAM: hypothetical protein K2H54_040610 [Gekko kuhli]
MDNLEKAPIFPRLATLNASLNSKLVVDVARSGDALGVGEGVNENGDADGSAGDEFEDENGVLGVDAGEDRDDEVEVTGADADVSAYDGGLTGPVGSSSFPSCDP